jgi:hypothetical protein
MKKNFTLTIFVVALAAISFNSLGQTCGTGGTFTIGSSYDFNSGLQGFTSQDFTVSANKLSSTNVSAGTTKRLTSVTLFQPSTDLNIAWGFDLGGQADVTSYTVEAIYFTGTLDTVAVCSGGVITGNNLTFSAPAPSVISGQNFQLLISLSISGTAAQNITIDNFTTSALSTSIVLPVKFSSLDARTINNSVSLKWIVASENNVTGYEIEKSVDGRNYSKIGFVNATGENSYSFVDIKPSTISYYRIKSVDVNGRYTYSTVVLVKAGKSIIVLKAFPSPFTKNLSIQHGTAGTRSLLTISAEDGRTIKSITPAAGTQQTEVDLSTAKPGMYLVRFTDGNGTSESLKILKQ